MSKYFWKIRKEQNTPDLTGLKKISLTICEPQALSAAKASGRNTTVVSRWCVTDLTEFKINRVPSRVLNCDESGVQEYFVGKKFVEKIGTCSNKRRKQ